MANIIRRAGWYLPEKLVTPETVFLNRRRFMSRLGLAGAGVLSGALAGCSDSSHEAGGGKRTFSRGGDSRRVGQRLSGGAQRGVQSGLAADE